MPGVVGVPLCPLPPFVAPFIGITVPYNVGLPVVPAPGRAATTFEKHGNLAYSTVATAPSPATTGSTMVLGADSSTFPSPTAPGALPYSVTVWPVSAQPTRANSEIVTFTALDPGTLTASMLRAQEGSTARTIIAGDQVALTHSLRAQTDVEDAILALDSRVAALERAATVAATAPFAALTRDTLTADGATFASSAIPQTYTDMLVVIALRTDRAGSQYNDTGIQLNSDASALYAYARATIQTTAVSAAGGVTNTSFFIGTLTTATGDAGQYSTSLIFIPNYSVADHRKVLFSWGVGNLATSSDPIRMDFTGGEARSNYSAVKTLQVVTGAGNFLAGSSIQTYGLGPLRTF